MPLLRNTPGLYGRMSGGEHGDQRAAERSLHTHQVSSGGLHRAAVPMRNPAKGGFVSENSTGKPEIIGWEITNQCNLSCQHCFTAAGKRAHGEMTTAECRTVIDAMADIGVVTIGWTGGEPLLRDDLEELIAYAAQKKIRSTVTTNAVLLDRERAIRLFEAGNRAVQISIDGSTPERNRKMRGTTDEEYGRIIDAIRFCKELNSRVILATVLGLENLDDAPAMLALAEREQVDMIRFCCYAPVGRGKRSDIKQRFGFGGALPKLLAFVEQAQQQESVIVDLDIGFGPVPPDYEFHQCIAGKETFYLKATGDLYPCTSLTYPQFLVGNLREQSLAELWQSPKMRGASEYPLESIEGHCRSCENFRNCRGGCRGVVLAHTGEIDASYPLCLYRLAAERTASK
ncbi:radical SAM protein [candidate division GN15 bacterium]|uniref:Radical SAM protein n=1 Tax=candidate division GN15 bacterium TaxID=2072418 RepID=A0A855X1S5_9BACT|nr:MAG: radical SAM protein [candidate division GN15 bacterium]